MTSAQARKTRMGISPGWLPLAIQTLCVHRRSLRLFTIPTVQGEGGERMERSCLTSPSYHCCELSRAAIDSTVEDNHAQNHKADHNAEECEGESSYKKEAPYREERKQGFHSPCGLVGWGEPTQELLARLGDNFKLG